MRTSTSNGVLALALTAIVGGSFTVGSPPIASAAPTESVHSGAVMLHLTAQTEQFAVIDVGSNGPGLGLGDQIVSSDRLSRSDNPAGRAGTVMTVVGTGATTLTTQVLTTLELPEGQIILQGVGDGPTGPPTEPVQFTLAVTGGTGRYRDARGDADILDRPGGTEIITVRLAGGTH